MDPATIKLAIYLVVGLLVALVAFFGKSDRLSLRLPFVEEGELGDYLLILVCLLPLLVAYIFHVIINGF